MHQCDMVISGSSKARYNNIDGFMRHGRPNDSDLPSNYFALQGQQLYVGAAEQDFKATVQMHNVCRGSLVKICFDYKVFDKCKMKYSSGAHVMKE